MLYLNNYQGNIEPLRDLVNLQAFYLIDYQGGDIGPLRGLVNLQTLDLRKYQGDVEPLGGLRNLEGLYLSDHPDQEVVRQLKRKLGID
jgi:Leucine-rich repeat (LRR) protein